MTKQTLLLGYRAFYSGLDSGYDQHVSNLSSRLIIQVTSIIGNQHLFLDSTSEHEKQNQALHKLFVNSNEGLYTAVHSIYNRFISHGIPTIIFNQVANLKIIERELANYRVINEDISHVNWSVFAEQYLKAYLSINDEIDKEQIKAFRFGQIAPSVDTTIDKALKLFIPSHLPYHEFTNKNDLLFQFHFVVNFLRFAESDQQLNLSLVNLLAAYQFNTWQDYLKEVYNLTAHYTENIRSKDNIFRFNNGTKPKPYFVDRLSHHVSTKPEITIETRSDFKFLRVKPIIQLADDEYIISNLQFLLDKVYQSFKFDYISQLVKDNFKANFGEVAGYISDKFSHKFFEKLMHKCFQGKGYDKLVGDDELNKNADFYVRQNNIVFLFEFKDEIIPATARYSEDFELIKKGIFEKFVANQKGKKKAIIQLNHGVVHFSKNASSYDSEIPAKVVYVPIIVYTDITLDFIGMNKILNDEFKKHRVQTLKELNKVGRGNVKGIEDLMIINLNLLVKYQDIFASERISLSELYFHFKDEVKRLRGQPIRTSADVVKHFYSTDRILSAYIYRKTRYKAVPVAISEEMQALFVNQPVQVNQ